MSSVFGSAFEVDLRRYRRSWGLWLLLVIAAAGARFMVARDDGSGIQVAIGHHLPVLDWPTLGVSLGVVVASILLPVAHMYLRANTTRVRPWQVDEVTPASRVRIALGRFAADVAVLAGMLAVLTVAGGVIGALFAPGPARVGAYVAALWLIAGPALATVAALRSLLDALPFGRRAGGDVVVFLVWIAALVAPLASTAERASYVGALSDLPGFVRPLTGPNPSPNIDVAIGATNVSPVRVPLDVGAGLESDGYVAARLTWLLIATALVALGGALYRPHTARRARAQRWLQRVTEPGRPPRADPAAPPAARSGAPWPGLVAAEFRLIGAGRVFAALALLVAVLGVLGDYRHIGSPAALLLLAFALSAQAGRADSRGLLALSATTFMSPWARRAAFVIAGTGWALLLSAPASLARVSVAPLLLAAEIGLTALIVAAALGWATGSGFVSRMVLLIARYGYLST